MGRKKKLAERFNNLQFYKRMEPKDLKFWLESAEAGIKGWEELVGIRQELIKLSERRKKFYQSELLKIERELEESREIQNGYREHLEYDRMRKEQCMSLIKKSPMYINN